jgi:quinol-cytochrome oxidoreductase complex cytochrome b subunit
MYQALKYMPKMIGIIGVGLVILALWMLPFLDRTPERQISRRPLAMSLGILFIVANLILALLGKIGETEHTIWGTRYHIDTYGYPHVIASPAEALIIEDADLADETEDGE